MRPPTFWSTPKPTLTARLLTPLSGLWAQATARRIRTTVPIDPGIPVICIGNVTSGGTGKTPVALALAQRLNAQGISVGILSRGYGGRERGPLLVDPTHHTAAEVGDEPLLLARTAPTVISHERITGAQALVSVGAQVILMDDGFQNPTLKKRLSILVLDGGAGLGNGRVIPAGPLREPWKRAQARADAVIVVGTATAPLPNCAALPILAAQLVPANPETFAGRRITAFAGIGRPEKFFQSLIDAGAAIAERHAFPDHHPYSPADLNHLAARARHLDAPLATTAKDAARLPSDRRSEILVLDVTLDIADWAPLDRLLAKIS